MTDVIICHARHDASFVLEENGVNNNALSQSQQLWHLPNSISLTFSSRTSYHEVFCFHPCRGCSSCRSFGRLFFLYRNSSEHWRSQFCYHHHGVHSFVSSRLLPCLLLVWSRGCGWPSSSLKEARLLSFVGDALVGGSRVIKTLKPQSCSSHYISLLLCYIQRHVERTMEETQGAGKE